MRYWVYDEKTKRVVGPHISLTLLKLPGFGPDTKVAPEGSKLKEDWKPAKDVPELRELLSTAPPFTEKPRP